LFVVRVLQLFDSLVQVKREVRSQPYMCLLMKPRAEVRPMAEAKEQAANRQRATVRIDIDDKVAHATISEACCSVLLESELGW
jgi:hypothetical protein